MAGGHRIRADHCARRDIEGSGVLHRDPHRAPIALDDFVGSLIDGATTAVVELGANPLHGLPHAFEGIRAPAGVPELILLGHHAIVVQRPRTVGDDLVER